MCVCVCRYENVVQVRCLYEGVSVEDMLSSWGELLPVCMQRWGLQRDEVSSSLCRQGACVCMCGRRWVGV